MEEKERFYSPADIRRVAGQALEWIQDFDDEIVRDFFLEIVREIAAGDYEPYESGIQGVEGEEFEHFLMQWIVSRNMGMGVLPYGATIMQEWRERRANDNPD